MKRISQIVESNNLMKILFLIIFLLLARYDFTFNLLPYKVATEDTLWSVLEKKIFHDAALTGLSIDYLESTYPEIKWNHLEKNKQGQGGYAVNVWMNKLSIKAPNNKFIIHNAFLLPRWGLLNHTIEVLVYNFILIAIMAFVYLLLQENNFVINTNFLKELLFWPLFLTLILFLLLASFFIFFPLISSFLFPQQPRSVLYQEIRRPPPVDINLVE
ncbi:hypothetical protein HY345_00790 [Candidatus Microgenomates bacterium]|nr:hypothetical protein [Candidatus Microgenomates bacterium]